VLFSIEEKLDDLFAAARWLQSRLGDTSLTVKDGMKVGANGSAHVGRQFSGEKVSVIVVRDAELEE
jgi:hypothetical protein